MDLCHHLIGDLIIAINKKLGLEVDADDVSEPIVKHINGVVSSIHTDIFGRKHKKFLK